ncbi:MAG: hypothetical protein OEW00_05610 [candidate division Zixibacteria bacterium]|nr:hypothetical protein [candidate division Zixibacteria bacterium]
MNVLMQMRRASLLLLLATTVLSATLCDQTFTIYGKTAGDHSIFWFDEYVGGECYFWEVNTVYLGYDRPYVMSMRHDGGGKDWVPQLLADLPSEAGTILKDSSGVFRINDSVSFTAPPPDSTFPRKHARLANDGPADARHWYRVCPVNCSDYPVFTGVEADLVYSHKRGLYKNYGISRAVYYAPSGYLVVITDQPQTAVGLDTMHGLLIYKLRLPQEGEEQ